MSNKIRVKELPKNPIERTYALDEYSGRLVVYLDKRWQFAEDATAYENSRNSYRKVVKQI